MLKDTITDNIKTAMKSRDTSTLQTLRVIKSEVERAEQSTSGKVDISDAEIIKIIKRMVEGVKQTTNDTRELAVLETYLPKQLTESEIKAIVIDLSASGLTVLGDYMKHFKTQYDGLYDGKTLSNIVKESI